jgi:hypothetical protein
MPCADFFFYPPLRFGNDDDYVLNRFLSHLPIPQHLSNPFSTPFTPVSLFTLTGPSFRARYHFSTRRLTLLAAWRLVGFILENYERG